MNKSRDDIVMAAAVLIAAIEKYCLDTSGMGNTKPADWIEYEDDPRYAEYYRLRSVCTEFVNLINNQGFASDNAWEEATKTVAEETARLERLHSQK